MGEKLSFDVTLVSQGLFLCVIPDKVGKHEKKLVDWHENLYFFKDLVVLCCNFCMKWPFYSPFSFVIFFITLSSFQKKKKYFILLFYLFMMEKIGKME